MPSAQTTMNVVPSKATLGVFSEAPYAEIRMREWSTTVPSGATRDPEV